MNGAHAAAEVLICDARKASKRHLLRKLVLRREAPNGLHQVLVARLIPRHQPAAPMIFSMLLAVGQASSMAATLSSRHSAGGCRSVFGEALWHVSFHYSFLACTMVLEQAGFHG